MRALEIALVASGMVFVAGSGLGCKRRGRAADVEEARPIVEAFVKTGADRPALFAALHPRASDYTAVFQGDAAARAKEALEPLWETSKGLEPAPEETEVEVYATTPDELAKGTGGAADCPGGYRGIADKFNPKITIYCFRFTKPGDQSGGLAGDALVKVDDHWAYFPKVFRYLK